MIIKVEANSFFIFDLDDTLFPEIEFLFSGYKDVLCWLFPNQPVGDVLKQMVHKYRRGEDVFAWLLTEYRGSGEFAKDKLIEHYREHHPTIQLPQDVEIFLNKLKVNNVPMGLITDGRSLTQRNKLKALGIEGHFQDIIISEEFGSEKPNRNNYQYFENKYPDRSFYFFGDNTSKDFIVPRQFGWQVFCIKDNGFHIHRQDLSTFEPSEVISSFLEIEINES